MGFCEVHKKEYHTICLPCSLKAKILSKPDIVNNPKHYQGKVECIDAIESAVEGLQGIEAVCVANVIKYIWRYKKKNGIEDLKKSQWYLQRLINVVDAS
jgi:hypothetical protein